MITLTAGVDYRAGGHDDDDGVVTNNTCLTPAKLRNISDVSATKSLRKAEEVVILRKFKQLFRKLI